jgi:release factor glutamine methyltransferase
VRLVRLPGVFEPHSDSWLLAQQMLREALPPGAAVLDLCTGSGLLAVLAADQTHCAAVAVDVCRGAVLTTKINARLNGVKVTALRGDLFEPVADARFDLIVSNPPYLPTQSDRLPRRGRARAWQAGPSGRAFIDRICSEAPKHLKQDGALLIVHSSVCGELETVAALARSGLTANVVARRRGRLGPLLASRVDWLRERRLIDDDGLEEILVIRGQRPAG